MIVQCECILFAVTFALDEALNQIENQRIKSLPRLSEDHFYCGEYYPFPYQLFSG